MLKKIGAKLKETSIDKTIDPIPPLNSTTELVFILDRSGSMAGLEDDTVGGFNAMIDKQKKEDGRCYVSTILFDHEVETLHDRVNLSEIQKLTDKLEAVRDILNCANGMFDEDDEDCDCGCERD